MNWVKSLFRNVFGATANKKTERLTGIGADAEALGVERTHLWRVVTGRRKSATLLRRYRQLKLELAA